MPGRRGSISETLSSIELPSNSARGTQASWLDDDVHYSPGMDAAEEAQMRQERTRARHEKLKGTYDFPDVLKNRETLSKYIHKRIEKEKGNSPPRAKEVDQASARQKLVNEWLAAERKRADEDSKKRWKDNFLAWHSRAFASLHQPAEPASSSPSAQQRPVSADSEPQSPEEEWTGLDPNDPDAIALQQQTEAYERQRNQLGNKQLQLERDIGRLKEELEAESQRRANLEQMLRNTEDDRNAWNASATRHDMMMRRLVQETQETSAQVAQVHRQLTSIGSTLIVAEGR